MSEWMEAALSYLRNPIVIGIECGIAFMLLVMLFGCASNPEVEDVQEVWTFAREHKTFEREDSKDVRYIADVHAECAKLMYAASTVTPQQVRGCTVMGTNAYTLLATDATAYEIAHEASHRVYGDWHKGYFWFTQRELGLMWQRRRAAQ